MELDNESIAGKIDQAQEAVKLSKVEGSFKEIAFQTTLKYLLNQNNNPQSTPNTPNPQDPVPTPYSAPDSLVGLIKKAGLSSHSDKILMMAYFMMTQKNTMTFNNKIIREKYFEIRESPSKNLTVEFNGLIKKGFIMPSQEGKSYVLTRAGIEYLEEKLKDDK